MIITFTPNPSVDRTITVSRLLFNDILRANNARVDWGGKGFNVSRGLMMLGQPSLALGWVGGGAGKMLDDGLNKLHIKTDFVWVDEETRTNTVVQEEASDWYMRVNEPGPHIPADAISEMILKTNSYANPGDIWVTSGSLPQGVPDNFYADLIRMLKAKGVRVFFESIAEPFRLGAKEAPWLVSPDVTEAEHLLGYNIKTFDAAKRAALGFMQQGTEYVALVIESGGLLLASHSLMVMASPVKVPVRNVTGAGDALMAGLVEGFVTYQPLVEIARQASAFRATWISHQDYTTIQREDYLEMLPKVEVRSVPLL